MKIELEGRPSWDEYFSHLCELVSSRATCPRKNVGAVIVKENHVLSIGYNGSLPGLPHCLNIGCDMEDGHCVAVVHAEANAICDAAARGTALQGATLYSNLYPCWSCFKLIVSAGITEIAYKEIYGDPTRVEKAWRQLKHIHMRQIQ
jgi:dCMP deaminase